MRDGTAYNSNHAASEASNSAGVRVYQ